MTQFLSKGELPNHIIVEQKPTAYKQVANYPVCEFAKLFASIAGTKTLTDEVCAKIESFSIEVEFEHTPVKAWKV